MVGVGWLAGPWSKPILNPTSFQCYQSIMDLTREKKFECYILRQSRFEISSKAVERKNEIDNSE